MSKPLNVKTHDAATATGAGEAIRTKGHVALGLFVKADSANLTDLAVKVEVSPDGTNWAPLTRPDGTEVSVSLAGLTGDTGYASFGMGMVSRHVRANITTHDGTGQTSVWLMTGGWNGPGFGV